MGPYCKNLWAVFNPVSSEIDKAYIWFMHLALGVCVSYVNNSQRHITDFQLPPLASRIKKIS